MSSVIKQTNKVTCVGGGLVGSLLAIFLARKGFEVEILERRSDPRSHTTDRGRSINLAISVRGLHALEQVGLKNIALENAIPMRGRMVHPLDGPAQLQLYGTQESHCIHSISRAWLNKLLLTEAEKTGKVKIRFSTKVTGADVEQKLLFTEDESGKKTSLPYEVTLGTDGSASALRNSLVEKKQFSENLETLEHGYKELTLPAGSGAARWQIEKDALHIWGRGTYMMIALPNLDGSFTCTLFLPLHGNPGFSQLQNANDLQNFFKTQFPDVTPLFPQLSEEFFSNPVGSLTTVRTAPWMYQDHICLLGDAAHAIVPFFGQGMNCGFEDCVTFAELLDTHTKWDDLFTSFYQNRKPNADAIALMAVENFIEMRDKVNQPDFIRQRQLEAQLQKEDPQKYASRYTLVSFTRTPYAEAYAAGERLKEHIQKVYG